MPLLDHFRPPLSVSHPWKGFHSSWANSITNQLNEVLPEGYYAIPEVSRGACRQRVEIHIFQDLGGPQLRAAIELVSPANNDRPRSRLTFAAKCVGYLERGVHVVVIDTVTGGRANLHLAISEALEAESLHWDSSSHLYAVSYRRTTTRHQSGVEAWPRRLNLGGGLPTLPLWIDSDLSLPLHLEASYETACRSLRVGA